MGAQCDFSGYGTKYNVRCSDGCAIAKNAFAADNGKRVPLVYQHLHNSIDNVLGHAILEQRDTGMYCYAYCNENPNGKNAKNCVMHGDLTSFSVFANKIKRDSNNVVIHGEIKEISLVLSGANPEAKIDYITLAHSDGTYDVSDEEVILEFGESYDSVVSHSDEGNANSNTTPNDNNIDADNKDVKDNSNIDGTTTNNTDDIEHSDKGQNDGKKSESSLKSVTEEDKKIIDKVIEISAKGEDGVKELESSGIANEFKTKVLPHLNDKQKEEIQKLIAEKMINTQVQHSDNNQNDAQDSTQTTNDINTTNDQDDISHAEGGKTIEDFLNTLGEENKNVIMQVADYAKKGNKGVEEFKKSDLKNKFKIVMDGLKEADKKLVQNFITLAASESEDANKQDQKSNDTVSHSDNLEGGNEMKENVFDQTNNTGITLSHSDIIAMFNDAKACGSLKESVLAHAEGDYGIENIDYLFPDAKLVNDYPELIKREDEWVKGVMDSVHKSPFSRIKSTAANLTAAEARAKGYVKGAKKTEEVITLLKRVTTPQTIYKKQKLDKDDINDITDFDVVVWMKAEMRMMLDEELARAILIGDGRLADSPDKIKVDNVRPIYHDDSVYTIRQAVAFPTSATYKDMFEKIQEGALLARKQYKGSGSPVMYVSPEYLTDMLLAKDTLGRALYNTETELASALRVSKIVEVPVFEGATHVDSESKSWDLIAIIVNLRDYTMGADKGGKVSLFEDFDIDYNQEKYLIETRCSGALIKPYSAIVLEKETEDAEG